MPLVFWILVIGGFLVGLADVLTRGVRREWRRRRWLRKEAAIWDFEFRRVPSDRSLVRLLRRFPTTGNPGGVFNLLSGTLEGAEVQFFEFVDQDGPVATVGCAFALRYDTAWPTLELGAGGGLTLGAAGHRPDGSLGSPRTEHDFSRALLSSEITEFLVSRRNWTIAFSGSWVLGTSFTIDLTDLDDVIEMAGGIARLLPPEVVASWSASNDSTAPDNVITFPFDPPAAAG